MYKVFLFLLTILFVSVNFAQDLPHKMTEEEKLIWQNFKPQLFPQFTNPPPTPVRTMAEWEELQGIIITWTSYTSILRQIVDYAQDEGLVYIVCSDSNSVKSFLTSGGVPLINLKFLITSFNSIWVRDYGPWSVYAGVSDTLKIIDWIYNRPRPLDDAVPVYFANYSSLPIHQTTTPPYDLIATGGNFMTDGHGTGFSSNLILEENPGKTETQIDLIMDKFMGLDRYIKMQTLPYDDIHHIDMHMKLLDEETLLVGQYPPGVADGPQIEANLQYILNNFLTCYGRPYKVVRIPMPPENGQYPPSGDYRTYTNSIIVNKTVIVPTYELNYDTTALRIYREAMPGYRVVGINSNAIITSLGAIHCITKEVGVSEPVYISHPKISGEIVSSDPIEVKAFIKTKSGVSNASVYWTTDTTQNFSIFPMTSSAVDTFNSFIPSQQDGAEVFYYISATSNSGKTITKPLTAPAGCYHFKVSNTVPVELLSFTASSIGNTVILNWITATEINNSGFEVQRKQVFSFQSSGSNNEWENIGFINGNGTTTEPKSYSFVDNGLAAVNPAYRTGRYSYRLKQIDFDGSVEYSNVISVELDSPTKFSLEQNYPNPFNPGSKISWQLPFRSWVTLKIFDALGRELETLVNEYQDAGNHSALYIVDSTLPSGIYFYQLKAGDPSSGSGQKFIQTKKMILLK